MHLVWKWGVWQGRISNLAKNDYGYNGKELVQEMDAGLMHYGKRTYRPDLGRFMSTDPISHEFPFVSTYNYAENEPITNIDLWGLQKVFFSKVLQQNQTFKTAYFIQRETTGGKSFEQELKKQKQISIFYTPSKFVSGFSYVLDAKNVKDRMKIIGPFLKTDQKMEIENLLSKNDNIKLLVMGILQDDCVDNCDAENIFSISSNLNHEEVSHGIPELSGKSTNAANEHYQYFGKYDDNTPSNNEILNKKEFLNTLANNQLNQIIKLAKEWGIQVIIK